MKIGFALCGSFCTYAQVFPVMELLTRDYDIVPILSQNAGTINSRFGAAQDHIANIQEYAESPPFYPSPKPSQSVRKNCWMPL